MQVADNTNSKILPIFSHPKGKPWPDTIYVSISIEIRPRLCSTLIAAGVVDGMIVIYLLDNVPTPTLKECETMINRFFFTLRGKMLTNKCKSPWIAVYENNNSVEAAWIESRIVSRSNISSIRCPYNGLKGLCMPWKNYNQAVSEMIQKRKRHQLCIWSDFDYNSIYDGMDEEESKQKMIKELSSQVYSVPNPDQVGDKIRPLAIILYAMKYVHGIL